MVKVGVLDGRLGDAGALLRSIDWAATPLGATAQWSQALRMMVGLLLGNRFPLLVLWGPEKLQLYNDACRPILGDKHPRSMGQPAAECWSEIWDIVGPMIEAPFRGEGATTHDDLTLLLERKGFREETHFKVAYSPIPDATVPETGIGGVLATVAETTEQVYAHRELRTLRELAARAVEAKTAEQACLSSALTFQENRCDVPFALFYLLDEAGQQARLVASTRWCDSAAEDVAGPPSCVDVEGDTTSAPWPLQVVKQHHCEVFGDLTARLGCLPTSAYAEPVQTAIALPLAAPDQSHAYGVLVCGVSPHRALDDGYRGFFELAAAQIVTAIRNARSHQEEARRSEALASIDRAKTTFFGNVSHELRTPLTLLLGPLADALAQRGRSLSGSDLEVAHRNALRLLKLVDALLDFSRIEAGRVRAAFAPLDLSALTTELAAAFRSTFERAGLRFTVSCAPLPAQVFVDQEMWEKVVLNLLSNAFKFTFDGEVALTLRAVEGHVELAVRDTGVGIAAAELHRLFERFHRIEGARARTQEGSGIGLALVQELVHMHGGTVRVQSTEGHGSLFTVRLRFGSAHLPRGHVAAQPPLVATALSAPAFVAEADRWLPEEAEPATQPGLPGIAWLDGAPDGRVLVVDDNADMRDYLTRKLRERWTVVAVGDGNAALALAQRWQPDVVVTDVVMPGLSGFALLSALRESAATRGVSVIMLSARAGEEARLEGLEAGANDYMVKPFSSRELMARVSTQIQLAKLRRVAEAERGRVLSFLMQLPVAITVFEGPNHKVVVKNSLADRITQGQLRVGESLAQLLPELHHRGLIQVFDRVYLSGDGAFLGDQSISLGGGRGAPEERWFASVLQPLRDAQGLVTGIVVAGYDVTSDHRQQADSDPPRSARYSTIAPVQREVTRRVLVVDDDEESAALVGEAVGALGHTVQVAYDGASALAIALSFRPQVALIDIGLPAMDGYELGLRLRQQGDPSAPVQLVAITGYGRESDVRRSRDAGFERHLVKPVALSELGELLAGMASEAGPASRDLRRAADHG